RYQLGALLARLVDALVVLLNESHVAPRIRPQGTRVVVGITGEVISFDGVAVPLFAGYLASFAANAHRSIGEEGHALILFVAVIVRTFSELISRRGHYFSPPSASFGSESGASSLTTGSLSTVFGMNRSVVEVPLTSGASVSMSSFPESSVNPARCWYSFSNSMRASPRGRRPALISHAPTLEF